MLSLLVLAFLTLGTFPALAQDQTARVWAIYAYTIGGETIPKVFPRPRSLTPYGAYQMHEAGSGFRKRYVSLNTGLRQPSTRVENLSPYLIDNDDVNVVTTSDGTVVASAQAFMQGVYPPLNESFNATYFDNEVELADGSVVSTPLGGYQYPSIKTFGPEDPQSLAIAGQRLCPKHAFANIQYIGSKEFWEVYEESAPFYSHLRDSALSAQFSSNAANYANATTIAEFLDYQVTHNESLLHSLSDEDVKRARWYAGRYMYATNGDRGSSGTVADGSIRTIAGQGQVSSVLNAFESTIQARGALRKMNFQFGSQQTAVSFISLLQVANTNSNFSSSLPRPGSSIVLELFSYENETYPTYPDVSELYVRFVLHNGTTTGFTPYPLFGHGPSSTAIPFSEFQAEMQRMTLGSTADWCQRCNSSAVFCAGAMKNRLPSPGRVADDTDGGGLSNVVAGVIGAAVSMAVLTLGAVVAFFACLRRGSKKRKRSLGGFKGNNKMASDSDLTFANPQHEDFLKRPAASARGHERHGSWEMNDRSTNERSGGSSSLGDEIEEEWRLHSTSAPTKTSEYV